MLRSMGGEKTEKVGRIQTFRFRTLEIQTASLHSTKFVFQLRRAFDLSLSQALDLPTSELYRGKLEGQV